MAHKIEEEIQIYICQKLAEYTKVPDIVKDLADQGIETTPQNIHKNYVNSDKWQKVIEGLREKYHRSYVKIPIARKVERLKMLQDIQEKAREDGQYGNALIAIRQAGEETKDLEPKQGEMSNPIFNRIQTMTTEEKGAKLADLLKKMNI